MLDRSKHELKMRQMLIDIYSSAELGKLLGFKGGTACYFLYGLTRFSTDLDFSLLDLDRISEVYEKLLEVLAKHGNVRDKWIKQNTIFFLLEHTPKTTAIKIEVSIRESEAINQYELIKFYGVNLLVMTKANIFANKLFALTNRPVATARDLYDINYFFDQGWEINESVLRFLTDLSLKEYLSYLEGFIDKNFTTNNITNGLNELLENVAQRDYVKTKLKTDVLRKIRIYADSVRSLA